MPAGNPAAPQGPTNVVGNNPYGFLAAPPGKGAQTSPQWSNLSLHSDIASWGVTNQTKQTVATLALNNRANTQNAASSGGYIYPKSLTNSPAINQQQCVELVRGLSSLGPANRWKKGADISPYVSGNHPDIPPGTPIATFKSDGSYPAASGEMGTPRLDGRPKDSSHAAIFLNYVRDTNGNITGMQILNQYENHPATVDTRYFITNIGADKNLDTVGYEYAVIQ